MNVNPFHGFSPYKLIFYVMLILTITSGVLLATLIDSGQPGSIDAQTSGPWVVERFDNGVQTFAMPDEDAWTADIGYAQRYGTLAQAQIATEKIGAGHPSVVREVVK